MHSPDRKKSMRKFYAKAMLRLLLVLVCIGSASSYASNPPQGRLVATFLYNAQGLRIEKQGERGTERYTYDDQSVLSQRDGSNALIAHYTYGPNRLIALEHKTEGTQFYLTDALNSIVNLMTTNGLVQARYQYDAFGNKRSESGSSWNRFAFTGYEEDKETNLLYAKARYYDADTGRFLSQDAWQGDNNIPPSLHKYLYAYANPTTYVDPDGNIVMLPILAYLAYTSAQTAVDVGVDRGIAGLTNDDDFSYTKSIATNFAINAVTAGAGGKIKNASKVAKFGVETAIDASVTTAYESGVEGKDAGSTFVENAASGVVGRVVGDKAAKHLTKPKLNVENKTAPTSNAVDESPSAKSVPISNSDNISVGYHATSPDQAENIVESGEFWSSTHPKNRLGDGQYVADTPNAARAEFRAHNKPDTPVSVVEIEYQKGKNLDLTALQENGMKPSVRQGRKIAEASSADTITAKSVREGGGVNTVIRNESGKPTRKVDE